MKGLPMSVNAGNFAPDKKVKNIIWIVIIILAVILLSKLVKNVGKGADAAGSLFDGTKGILDGFFEIIGAKQTPEDKENTDIINDATRSQNSLGVKSAWSPLYYQQKAGGKLITQAKTDALVKQLWDSVGYMYDSPELFVSAIKQCGYKTQISWLAYNFNKKYNQDLLTWASRKFDNDDQQYQLAVAIKYVDSLPSGF